MSTHHNLAPSPRTLARSSDADAATRTCHEHVQDVTRDGRRLFHGGGCLRFKYMWAGAALRAGGRASRVRAWAGCV